MTTSIDPALKAVADPNRRRILHLLAQRPSTANELLESFEFSQPAMSQHLGVLVDASLVTAVQEGRSKRYRLDGGGLRSISEWIETYERFWDDRFDRLGRYLEGEDR